MAFVRRKGKSFYLVHNVREEGRVRQVHLACLGNRPRIGEEVIEQVRQQHPQMQIDWNAVRSRAAESFVSPFTDVEGAQQLLRTMRTLHLDLEEMDLGSLRRQLQEKSAPGQANSVLHDLMREMERLRSSLEAKIKQQPGNDQPTDNAREETGD